MRAVVKRSFLDLREKRAREEGEVFELTEDRFKEINRKLNGYIVETDAPATAEADAAEEEGAEDPASDQGEQAESAPEPAAEPEAEAEPKRRTASTKAKKPADK